MDNVSYPELQFFSRTVKYKKIGLFELLFCAHCTPRLVPSRLVVERGRAHGIVGPNEDFPRSPPRRLFSPHIPLRAPSPY